MISLRNASVVAALLLISCSRLLGQDNPIEYGDRIRVSVTGLSKPIIGTLLALDTDSLVMRVEDKEHRLAMPLSSVGRLEVYRGQKSKEATGAAIGAAVGVAAGIPIALSSSDQDCGDWGLCRAGNVSNFFSPLILGVVGALAGKQIGQAIKVDAWEEVPLDEIRAPLGRRPAISASNFW